LDEIVLPDEGGIIKIFHVLCSANSKALTVDELEGRRKKVVSQVLDTLHNDVCRAMNAAAATAEFEARVKRDSDGRDHWKRKFIASIKEESAARVAVYKALPDSAFASIETLGEAVSQGLFLPLLAQGKYLLWLEDPSLSMWEMGNQEDSRFLGFNAARGRRLARRRLLLQESAAGTASPETVALALEDCRDRRLVTGADAAALERKDHFSGETPLITQVQLGEYENAKRLLQAGADANAATAGGDRPLLMAAKEGRDDLVQLLSSFGARVDGSDGRGKTALHWASEGGHVAAVQRLLKLDADLEAADEDGKTALMLAIGPKSSVMCGIPLGEGHRDVVGQLLDKGADVNARNQDGMTALMFASEEGHTEVVQQLLDRGADVNANSKENGDTALMLASSEGHTEAVRQLLGKGADVNAHDKFGRTALIDACFGGSAEVVRQLLDKGSDVNVQCKGADVNKKWDGKTALMLASNHGKTEIAGQLLDKGADVNVQDIDGNTALELSKDAAMFECLRTAGAKTVDITDENKNSLLLRYARFGDAPLLRAVLQAGANLAHTDEHGKTPLDFADTEEVKVLLREHGGRHSLFHAARVGMFDVVAELIGEGADVNEKNKYGKTPLDYADTEDEEEEDDEENEDGAALAAAIQRKILLQSGADWPPADGHGKVPRDFDNTEEVKVLLREHGGRHSLFHAVQNGMLDAVAELIREGADVHEEDKDGDTALYYAEEIEDEEKKVAVLALLAEHGLKEEEEEED